MMRLSFTSLLSFILLVSDFQGGCKARTLSDLGPTFEIQERSFLEMVQSRMAAAKASGKLDEIEAEVKARVQNKAIHPPAVQGLSSEQIDRRYYFDPTITVEEDIQDHRGVVIHHKGKRLNPLHYVSWGSPMVFIDGEDEAQVKWALSEHKSHGGKIVLVKGSPIELYRQTGVRFYFDQAGKITSQFDIKHVPARVSQDGDHPDRNDLDRSYPDRHHPGGDKLLIEYFILKKGKET